MKAAVKTMEKPLTTITASSVACGRRGDYKNNPLAGVSFVVYVVGLSISGGELKSIGYKTDWQRNHQVLTDEEIKKRGFTKLDKPGWYIYEAKS